MTQKEYLKQNLKDKKFVCEKELDSLFESSVTYYEWNDIFMLTTIAF